MVTTPSITDQALAPIQNPTPHQSLAPTTGALPTSCPHGRPSSLFCPTCNPQGPAHVDTDGQPIPAGADALPPNAEELPPPNEPDFSPDPHMITTAEPTDELPDDDVLPTEAPALKSLLLDPPHTRALPPGIDMNIVLPERVPITGRYGHLFHARPPEGTEKGWTEQAWMDLGRSQVATNARRALAEEYDALREASIT